MTVEADHVYFVGDLTVIVHNANCQQEASAIRKITNTIKDHLKPGDVSGAVRDGVGNPVAKATGGFWDHAKEVTEAINGLRRNAAILAGSKDPAAIAARQAALQKIRELEDVFNGLGI